MKQTKKQLGITTEQATTKKPFELFNSSLQCYESEYKPNYLRTGLIKNGAIYQAWMIF